MRACESASSFCASGSSEAVSLGRMKTMPMATRPRIIIGPPIPMSEPSVRGAGLSVVVDAFDRMKDERMEDQIGREDRYERGSWSEEGMPASAGFCAGNCAEEDLGVGPEIHDMAEFSIGLDLSSEVLASICQADQRRPHREEGQDVSSVRGHAGTALQTGVGLRMVCGGGGEQGRWVVVEEVRAERWRGLADQHLQNPPAESGPKIALLSARYAGSVDARDDAAADEFAVLVPVLAVLFLAGLVVAELAVYEEDGKVGDVKVRDGGGKAAGERPGPRHGPVAEVVGVARAAPPARGEELAAGGGGHVLEVLGVGSVAELVLLGVGLAEDVVAGEVDGDDGGGAGDAEVDGVEGEVARLEAVDEGDPYEVADGEHESEAVGGDVHGGEDGRLHEEGVGDVPEVESADEGHGVGDATAQLDVLVAGAADVENGPEDEARTELVERLDVERADARVELASDEPVVEHVARVAAEGEQLTVGERDEVAVDRLGERVEEGGRDEAGPVLVEDGEGVGALDEDPGGGGGHGDDKGGKGVELVVEALAGAQLGSFKVLAGEDEPGDHGECVPGGVDGPGGGPEVAAELLGASKVEVVGEEGHGERDKGGAERACELVVGEAGVDEEEEEDDFLVGELRDELERGAGVGVAGAGELSTESEGNETRPLDLRGVREAELEG
ncbi:hypothetical protein L1887_56841 [Cichorium endivia]|nr:hypothetical protein L1887_56841 [Cichorium endivia]